MKKVLILSAVLLVLSGCATQEYVNERQSCTNQSYQNFPVKNVQTVVRRSKAVQVQDGIQCINTGMMVNCQPTYRTVYQDYDSNETVDTNASSRNAFIGSCTRQACIRRYGNPDCER